MKLKRFDKNPIIVPNSNWWASSLVFNPAAAIHENSVYLIYRAVGEDHLSRLGLAISHDGYSFETNELSVFEGDPSIEWERLGVEDPRITVIENEYYMTYVAASVYPAGHPRPEWSSGAPWRTRVCLAKSNDLRDFQRLGVILPDSDNKDAVIFPEKISGRWALIHREYPNMWIAYSDDLLNWTDHKILMSPRPGRWDCNRLGAGAVPFKTELGWLEIYHGVDDSKTYSLGISVHDLENPEIIIGRSDAPILEPTEWYEREGLVPNVCFSCGALILGDELFVYYGAADTRIAVATVKLSNLMDYLKKLIKQNRETS